MINQPSSALEQFNTAHANSDSVQTQERTAAQPPELIPAGQDSISAPVIALGTLYAYALAKAGSLCFTDASKKIQ